MTNLPILIGILVSLVGSGGIVFGALRYNREEASGYISIMRDLNDELEEALNRARLERDEASKKARQLHDEVELLRREIRKLRELLEAAGITP